jgi:hypothetical protein
MYSKLFLLPESGGPWVVEKLQGFSETDEKAGIWFVQAGNFAEFFTKMLSGQKNIHQTMLIKCLNYL